jgi:hypothetical protein
MSITYAESRKQAHYAQCHYAECCCDEWPGAKAKAVFFDFYWAPMLHEWFNEIEAEIAAYP